MTTASTDYCNRCSSVCNRLRPKPCMYGEFSGAGTQNIRPDSSHNAHWMAWTTPKHDKGRNNSNFCRCVQDSSARTAVQLGCAPKPFNSSATVVTHCLDFDTADLYFGYKSRAASSGRCVGTDLRPRLSIAQKLLKERVSIGHYKSNRGVSSLRQPSVLVGGPVKGGCAKHARLGAVSRS